MIALQVPIIRQVRIALTLEDRCVKCPQEDLSEYVASQVVPFMTLILVVLLLLAVWAMGSRTKWACCGEKGCIRRAQKHVQGLQIRFLTKGKIMFSFGQIATLFIAVYDIPFPTEFREFVSYLAFFNIDIFRWVPLDCWVDFDFHTGLVLSTLFMLLLPCTAIAAQWAAQAASRKLRDGGAKLVEAEPHQQQADQGRVSQRQRTGSVARKAILERKKRIEKAIFKRAARARAITGYVFCIAFAIYPSVSSNIFKTFNCGIVQHANNETTSYLKADYSIDCLSAKHRAWQLYAYVMMVIISFGTPVLYLWLLHRNRAALQENAREAEHLLFLCQDYTPDCYWWEVVETVRKLMLTGVAVFVERDTILQVVVALFGAIALLSALVHFQPYHRKFDNRYAILTSRMMVFYIFIGLLLKVDEFLTRFKNVVAPESDYVVRHQGYGTGALALALIVVVGTVLVAFFVYLYRDYQQFRKEPVMRYKETGELVYFPKPARPESFDALLVCAFNSQLSDLRRAKRIRNELHERVDTIGIAIHDYVSEQRKVAADVIGAAKIQLRKARRKHCGCCRTFKTCGKKPEVIPLEMDFEHKRNSDLAYDRDLERNHTLACVLTKDFFTDPRCVKLLKLAHEKWAPQRPQQGAQKPPLGIPIVKVKGGVAGKEEKMRAPRRRIIFIHDEELISASALCYDATTQNERKTKDAKIHRPNLFNRANTSNRRRQSLYSARMTPQEGAILHDWLIHNLPGMLRIDAAWLKESLGIQGGGQKSRAGAEDDPYRHVTIIPWYGDEYRTGVAVKRFVQEALCVAFDKWPGEGPKLKIPKEITSKTRGKFRIELPPAKRSVMRRTFDKGEKGEPGQWRKLAVKVTKHLYFSEHHNVTTEGKDSLEEKLQERLKDLEITRERNAYKDCTHMLVVLDHELSESSRYKNGYIGDVHRARNAGLALIVLHLDNCDFGPFAKDPALQAIGSATDPAIVIPCPDWRKPKRAAETEELVQVALARIGKALEGSEGVEQAPKGSKTHQFTIAAKKRASEMYKSVSRRVGSLTSTRRTNSLESSRRTNSLELGRSAGSPRSPRSDNQDVVNPLFAKAGATNVSAEEEEEAPAPRATVVTV